MAATSQPLLQGGMRTRDWFSDKLGGRRGGGWMGKRRSTLMSVCWGGCKKIYVWRMRINWRCSKCWRRMSSTKLPKTSEHSVLQWVCLQTNQCHVIVQLLFHDNILCTLLLCHVPLNMFCIVFTHNHSCNATLLIFCVHACATRIIQDIHCFLELGKLLKRNGCFLTQMYLTYQKQTYLMQKMDPVSIIPLYYRIIWLLLLMH